MLEKVTRDGSCRREPVVAALLALLDLHLRRESFTPLESTEALAVDGGGG